METKEDKPRCRRYCRLDWIPYCVGSVGQDEEEFVQAGARTRKGDNLNGRLKIPCSCLWCADALGGLPQIRRSAVVPR